MAKWTGEIKRVKRWFRSDKLLVQFRKEPGDHNRANDPELYWCEVDPLRLDIIAFDLSCRRAEVDTLAIENKRLREKLVLVGSDTKIDVRVGCEVDPESLAIQVKEAVMGVLRKESALLRSIGKPDDVDNRTVADCKSRFGEEALEPFGFLTPGQKAGEVPCLKGTVRILPADAVSLKDL